MVISVLIIGDTAYHLLADPGKIQHYNIYGIPVTVEEIDRQAYRELQTEEEDEESYTLQGVIVVPPPVVEVHDWDWIAEHLYEVETYADNGDGTYEVTLVNVEPAGEFSFDILRNIFQQTEWTDVNGYALANGVNCQGMAVYIADWCKKNGHAFAIEYYPEHVAIRVKHDEVWYRFSFSENASVHIIEE